MAKIIFTNGTEKKIMPKNGTDFSLEELQEIVGGYIEIIRISQSDIIVVNEEGLIYNLPFNPRASLIAHMNIVGNVLICDTDMVR